MKKYILMFAALLGLNTFAFAADGDPNRMLVVNTDGSFKSHNIANVEEVKFATINGDVAADVTVSDFSLTSLTLSTTMTDECTSYLLNVVPGVIAHQIEANPASAGSYLRSLESPSYAEDYTNASLTGINLSYGTEYAVVTLGIDQYQTDCDVRAAYFTTESAPIVGNPHVDVVATSVGYKELGLRFTANSDVKEFYFVIGPKGEMEKQYEMFAGMFGFTNIGQMVQMWGQNAYPGGTTTDYKYTNLDPNTQYELYVQSLDANGNFAPVQIENFATKAKGGSGESVISIELGRYELADWDGLKKYSQFIQYTPNDQTWAYRIGVYFADDYDKNRDEIIENLCKDPEMSTANWFQYDAFEYEVQINPGVSAVAIAAGKNADGVWGKIAELRFTTPANPAGVSANAADGSKIIGRYPVSAAHSAGLLRKVSNKISITKR